MYGNLNLQLKVKLMPLKNFSLSESKFKSQTKQCCTTAVGKYFPELKLLLGLYSVLIINPSLVSERQKMKAIAVQLTCKPVC